VTSRLATGKSFYLFLQCIITENSTTMIRKIIEDSV
jgi:hypothetical protein